MNSPHPPHVLVLGCGRSGTSIFGELFDHLRSYHYLSEPAYDDFISRPQLRGLAVKVPRECTSPRPTPGLSFPLEHWLQRTGAAGMAFWIVRHPLDTICSLRIGIDQDWGHHPRPPDWQEWLRRPLIERCAHHWSYINGIGYERVRKHAHLVHFEAMIADPTLFALGIIESIGLNADRCDVDLRHWAQRVQNTNNHDFREAETSRNYSRPDHSVRVGRWRENLTPSEVQSIVPLVADVAERFGYSLTAEI